MKPCQLAACLFMIAKLCLATEISPAIKTHLEKLHAMGSDDRVSYARKLAQAERDQLAMALLDEPEPRFAYLAFQIRSIDGDAKPMGEPLAALTASGKLAQLEAEERAAGRELGTSWALSHSPITWLSFTRALKRYWGTGTADQRSCVERYLGFPGDAKAVEARLDADIKKAETMAAFGGDLQAGGVDLKSAVRLDRERGEKEAAGTHVSDMHDEPLPAGSGRVGVRLKFAISFPEDELFTPPALFGITMYPDGELHDRHALQLHVWHWESDPPVPTQVSWGNPTFRKDETYRITADMVPGFYGTSPSPNSHACVEDVRSDLVSDPSLRIRYRIEGPGRGRGPLPLTTSLYCPKDWFDTVKTLPSCPKWCGTELCK